MSESEHREQASERALADSAMLMLQLAASQAEIGPFARRSRETPQMAAGRYRDSARLLHGRARRA